MLNVLSPLKILTIILLEGFITISLEILTIRQLIPLVGNSVIVTSLIIGVFLLCLAYGYRAGGLPHGEPRQRLRRNFLWAALGIGIGLSYVFIEYFFAISHTKLGIPLLWSLLLYLLCVTAPVVYLLGQTVPITMNLLREQQTVGELGGKVLHLSTLGSFLGAVLTTLLLMNYFGVAWTIIIDFGVLVVLFGLVSAGQGLTVSWLMLLCGAGLSYIANRGLEQLFFIKTTPYANYAIIPKVTIEQDRAGKLLAINDSPSSFIDAKRQGFAYIERIKTILFHDLKISHKNILVLGAGGFTLSAAGTYGNHFTYVDIDPKIYSLVQQHFLSPIQGDFVAADARLFVKSHPHAYDVIISDVYSNVHTIPAHLLSKEYFVDLKTALKPDGIAIFNIIVTPLLNSTYAKRVDNTIRRVFPACTVSPVEFSWHQPRNVLYVCQLSRQMEDNTVYSDDKNQASLDFYLYE